MATYLVTGTNRGIGLEYCKQLQQRGDDVIAVCRSSSDDLDALGVRVESGVDITSDVAKLVQKLQGVTLDVLINNAGIVERVSLNNLDFDSIRKQFEVNAIGPLRLTKVLLPNLKEGSKVAMMTSRMGSIEDNTSGGSYGYRMSKVALSMAGKSLAVDLKAKGIIVLILHPGWVRTDMGGDSGLLTVEESVEGELDLIARANPAMSGRFFHVNGQDLPW